MSLAYYNEHDEYAAEWIRNLIAAGHIAPGVVDSRDIRDINPDELRGFTQCHFFAGIGVWSYALRQAGISDDRPLWTGSCPCQPFSAAGGRKGIADERHLWPHWFHLISECRPLLVLGEQVASKDGLGWYDLVSADLEGAGYAVGAVDLCAAGLGVEWQESQGGEWLRRAIHDCTDPRIAMELDDFADWAGAGNIGDGGKHIRQRLYFVGLADSPGRGQSAGIWQRGSSERPERSTGGHRAAGGLADTGRGSLRDERLELGSAPSGMQEAAREQWIRSDGRDGGDLERLADSMHAGRSERRTIAGNGQTAGLRAAGGVGDGDDARPQGHGRPVGVDGPEGRDAAARYRAAPGVSSGLADNLGQQRSGRTSSSDDPGRRDEKPATPSGFRGDSRTDPGDSRRDAVDWLFCRDGKWRAVESCSFPLDTKVAARVGKLRAFGNALDAKTATRFCEVVREIVGESDQ